MLTEEEKGRCRYHLGYMETSFAASVQFGLARPVQTAFILEQSFALLTNPYAVDRVRSVLATLDGIEEQMRCGTQTLVAAQLGDMRLHPLADSGQLFTDSLEKEYGRWARRLADILGAPLYAYAERFRRRGPGTSVPVS